MKNLTNMNKEEMEEIIKLFIQEIFGKTFV